MATNAIPPVDVSGSVLVVWNECVELEDMVVEKNIYLFNNYSLLNTFI